MVALDAVHGPTLTIEGRDAGGDPRAWYVRLWNFARGTPEDAVVTLDFDALIGLARQREAARRFANAVNFRGEPFLPGIDLLTRYPGA